MATPDDVLAVLNLLYAAYPDKPLTKETIRLYVDALEDIPVEALQHAAQEYIRTYPWFPKISDLLNNSRKLSGELTLNIPPQLPYRELLKELIDLQASMANGEPFDSPAWQRLADKFQLNGYVEKSEQVRLRLTCFQMEID